MTNSWELLEEVEDILRKAELETKDVKVDWATGQVTFRCFSKLDLKELTRLFIDMEAHSLTLEPKFNYNGAWNLVTMEVNLPGRSDR